MTYPTARKIFWFGAVFYAAVWTILPTLWMPGYRLDVPEMIFVGKESVLGYPKHPTFHTWWLEIVEVLTGRARYAPFLASQLCVLICFWGIWRTARVFFAENVALLGTFSMVGYYYFAYESTQYNNHLPLMAAVVLTNFFLVLAFEENRFRWWFAAGISIGIALLCKYQAIFLVVAILFFMTLNARGRTYWRFLGPYLTTLTATLIFLPHFVWLVENHFSVLQYIDQYAHQTTAKTILKTLDFAGSQFLFVLPMVAALLPITGLRWCPQLENDRKRFFFAFLVTLILVPVGLHLVVALVGKMRLMTNYTAFLWPMFSVVWLFGVKESPSRQALRRSAFLCGVMALLMGTILAAECWVTPYFIHHKTCRFLFPAKALGSAADRIWHEEYPDLPCRYVTGEWWLAGNAAITMESNPHVLAFMDPDGTDDARSISSWCTVEDVRREGGLFFWTFKRGDDENGIPDMLRRDYPDAKILDPISFPYHRLDRTVTVGIGVIPPAQTSQ